MHRNTYINSGLILDNTYNMRENKNIFFAGQITGVEGYVESISSGFLAGINAVKILEIYQEFENIDKSILKEEYEKRKVVFDNNTVLGALSEYISTENSRFQPMNANFGILPKLEENIKDKKLKYQKMADRSLNYINNIYKKLKNGEK